MKTNLAIFIFLIQGTVIRIKHKIPQNQKKHKKSIARKKTYCIIILMISTSTKVLIGAKHIRFVHI